MKLKYTKSDEAQIHKSVVLKEQFAQKWKLSLHKFKIMILSVLICLFSVEHKKIIFEESSSSYSYNNKVHSDHRLSNSNKSYMAS